MTLPKKMFLFGAGSGIVLALALLQLWGTYLERSAEAAAQPHLLHSFKPTREVPLNIYEGFSRPWFPEKLSEGADRWKITPMAGPSVALSHFKRQVVFLNLWSTTCMPCIEEMPAIEKLQASLKGSPVVFLAVAEDPRSEVSNFLAQRNLGVPIYTSDEEPPRELAAAGVPITYIVSGDGNVVFKHSGALNWDDDRARAFLLNLVAQTTKQTP
jgi:thiol-disulfide isomerase/thioredoxin